MRITSSSPPTTASGCRTWRPGFALTTSAGRLTAAHVVAATGPFHDGLPDLDAYLRADLLGTMSSPEYWRGGVDRKRLLDAIDAAGV